MLLLVLACLLVAAVVLLWLIPSWRASRCDGQKRIVLVTGAAMGLGRELANRCARAGDFVVALDANAEALSALEAELGGPKHALCLRVNVTDTATLAAAAADVQKHLGQDSPLDSICNFAGVIRGGPLLEMDDHELALVMDVNVLGTARVNKIFFPLLRRDGSNTPKIINIASEVSLAWLSAGFNGPYSMSKFAVEAYSAALRQELALLNPPVRVVVLNPGAMSTPMLKEQRPGASNSFFQLSSQRDGTLFGPALLKAAPLAADYMRRNASNPSVVSDTTFSIIHSCSPLSRYVIGASFEMRYVMPFLPQRLLDVVMLWLLKT